MSKATLTRHFDTWRELCEAAGVEPGQMQAAVPEDALFAEMARAFRELGGIVSQARFDRRFKFTKGLFYSRGWRWAEAKVRFRDWAAAHDPDFPYIHQLPTFAPPPRRDRRPPEPGAPLALVHQPRSVRLMGEPLGFRAMARAPVNENGVVILFGMVAEELGYSIELMNAGFPDCEASRRVVGNRWERVRLEYEHRSRNFLAHGHDAARCDVLVCWDHNWPECPIEVLELSKIVKTLPPHPRTAPPQPPAEDAATAAPETSHGA